MQTYRKINCYSLRKLEMLDDGMKRVEGVGQCGLSWKCVEG